VATLLVETINRSVIDLTGLTHTRVRVTGGLCGVVIDARGRPFDLPVDAARRRELLKRWAAGIS
jgi:hypothetical protein